VISRKMRLNDPRTGTQCRDTVLMACRNYGCGNAEGPE